MALSLESMTNGGRTLDSSNPSGMYLSGCANAKRRALERTFSTYSLHFSKSGLACKAYASAMCKYTLGKRIRCTSTRCVQLSSPYHTPRF